jgi:arabinan endo-1,5-alpha-L-arabinosidase
MNDNAGDTTVVDSTENELDGTAIRNTSVMHNADGIVSGALNFDGVDDFISLGVSDLLKPTDATTLSAWVFIPSDFDYQEGIIFSSNEPGVAGGVTMTCFYDYEGSGVWQLRYLPDNIWAGDIPVNQWVHLATTVDGDYVDMYIDGVSVYHGASAGTMPQSSTAIVTIGAYQDNGYVRAFLRGGIDDVRIYDRALTGDEIAELAEGTEAE